MHAERRLLGQRLGQLSQRCSPLMVGDQKMRGFDQMPGLRPFRREQRVPGLLGGDRQDAQHAQRHDQDDEAEAPTDRSIEEGQP